MASTSFKVFAFLGGLVIMIFALVIMISIFGLVPNIYTNYTEKNYLVGTQDTASFLITISLSIWYFYMAYKMFTTFNKESNNYITNDTYPETKKYAIKIGIMTGVLTSCGILSLLTEKFIK